MKNLLSTVIPPKLCQRTRSSCIFIGSSLKVNLWAVFFFGAVCVCLFLLVSAAVKPATHQAILYADNGDPRKSRSVLGTAMPIFLACLQETNASFNYFYSVLAAQLVLPFKETSKWRDLLKLQSNARWVWWLNQSLVSLFYATMSHHQCKATCSHPLHRRLEKPAF